jgi:hypothetical protein
MWDPAKAAASIDAQASKTSLGLCARHVREAVAAGGLQLVHHASAKDYGSSLLQSGFRALPGRPSQGFLRGDVAVIEAIPGHPHGHMCMFDGDKWVSDFVQEHGLYPGPSYRALKPAYTVYRHTASP